jgi:hypothetical protein
MNILSADGLLELRITHFITNNSGTISAYILLSGINGSEQKALCSKNYLKKKRGRGLL